MNRKLFHVIRREYLQQIKTKGFWIGTILIPTLGLVFVYLQVILASTLIPEGKIGVVDLTGRLYAPLVAEQKAVSDVDEKDGKVEEKSRGEVPPHAGEDHLLRRRGDGRDAPRTSARR